MKMIGPFDARLDVHVTNGNQIGKADYRLPRGEWPSKEAVQAAMTKAEQQVKEQFGDEWRLCTKREYFDAITEDVGLGMKFALPGGPDWDE